MARTREEEERIREAARKAAQKNIQNQSTARIAAEKVVARTGTQTKTEAGTKAPASGVSANRGMSRAGVGLSNLGNVRSFEEYAKKRRLQEEAEGMSTAAQKLNTAYGSEKPATTMGAVVNQPMQENEERKAMREAANKLANQYGYKNVAGKAVYATPFSPLPDPTGERGATKAQAPGAYGIVPAEYVGAMNAFDRYKELAVPEIDEETKAFLDKYFGGSIPTAEQFDETYQQLYSDFSVPDEEVSYYYHRGTELVGNATNEQEKYRQELAEVQAGYDAAVKLLGENAEKYATGREADYYERYRNTMGAKEAMAETEPLSYRGYGSDEDMSLSDAEKYTNSPYANQGKDRFALQRWSQTTQEEREAYKLMRQMYGEETAESYMQSLEPELNQRLAQSKEQIARAYAEQKPVLSSARSVLTAPVRGVGMLEMGVEKLLGNDVDLYDPRLNLTRETEAIRGEVAQKAGNVGGFLYQTGMSILDNLANMAVWGGLGSAASLTSMGLSSGASAFNSAVDRGASKNQAFGAALLSGTAEMLFEKFSLDNVITLAKSGGLSNFVGNTLKQMGIEASEELATSVANEISDRLVMGELSNYEQNVELYMKAGMSEDEAKWKAGKDTATEIGLDALGGALSGGVMGAGGQGIAALNRNTEIALQEAARQLEESQQQETETATPRTSAAQTLSPRGEGKTPDVRDALLREYAPKIAQEEAQQAETPEAREEPDREEKPAEGASEGEKEQRFTQARGATVRDEDGVESRVNVVGVMMNDGTPVMVTENENGEIDYALADDLTFDDKMGELLGYEGIANMDAKGLRSYLEGWDGETAAEDYARAYASVYQRAGAGLDYDQAAMQNGEARSYLTEDARMSAYAAGLNAYNQTHDTVQAASIETAEGPVAENAQLSAKEMPGKARLSRRYTQAAFSKLGKEGRNSAIAQMELLAAIASRTGRTITVVDSITGRNGQRANAMYDPKTGEIRVALDATGGAYTYAAMHELTHAVRNEHANEWDGFQAFVRDGLKANGQNWDELVSYQMDRFGYDRATAEEEVICNTVPALLQDERNVLKLYKGNRTLFERVVDWVKGLLQDVKTAGKQLSTRSQSWAQMDALKNDRELLQGMYDRLMAVMEKPAEENAGETRVVKLSAKESSYDPESAAIKEQIANSRELLNSMDVVVSVTVPENLRSKKAAQEWAVELLKSTGYRVDRQNFGVITFNENDIRYAMNYANTEAEKAAIAALPKVLKRGVEIGRHNDHKKRAKQTVTIAAPVELNGIRGNMAVVVNLNGNHYYTHRIVLPDGSVFKFNAQQKEAAQEPHRGVTVSSSLADATSTASDNSIAENGENVKFSLRDTDENVQDALTAQQQAFQQVRSHRITAAEADKLAGEMLKEANSTYDRQRLAAEISRIYDYIERGEDINWNQVDDELSALSARVMEKSRTLDLEHEEMAKPIRDYLRKTGIRMTESQRREAESLTGSHGAYRKALFGRVRLSSTSGTPLDSLWGELNGMNAELFPADAAEGEMPSLLMTAVDALKPVYHTGKGMNVEESANWLAGKLNDAYFSLPAVKAAAQNARTFGDSIRDLKAALKRFEETSWTEYQSALRSIKEARTAETRTRKQEETAALRAKYQNWRDRDTAARKERELKAKYRVKIERTATALTNWLYKPTDAKHVPAAVEDSVRRMIASLDFSGKDTKVAGELSERINSMADALLQAQEGEDENRSIFLERDQQMIDELRRVAELIRGNTEHQQMEGRGVYDLNGMELRELSKWLDVVRHVVTESSKLRGSNLPGESVEQVAAMSMQEISQKKAWKDKKWVTKQWNQYFGPDMQDSFSFFERLGSTTNAIFMELRRGFDKVTKLTRQAEEHTKTILEGVNLKELTGKKAEKQTFDLQKGGRLEMTKAQIMELYVLSKREQAQGHIYGEGIRIQGDEDARPHQLTKADVTAITGTLTEDEKRVADGLQKFLSKECAGWGNETSMKLLGYRKFDEEYYWPIRTDSNTRNTTKLEDNYAANINAIKNQGMTKATIEGAKNAIVVSDIFDTYTRHISNMAAYAGYALPLSDFTRWYNSRGVKTEIEQVLGPKGLKYINNFLMAVNGSALREEQSGAGKLAGKFSRNAKIASVGGNIRVVVQQPTSYARAAMYMSPKYLSGALTMKNPSGELVNRYCGIAQWKRWGFYETNIGPNLRQMIVGDETAADKAREIFMKPAAAGDDWTLNHLWNACELETRELYPELERGSEEYYQQVGARMSEIIDRTQVVDSVFHRSQMMRSKNAMDQMLTNFMSEPTKTYNLLMCAISDYADNRKNKAARNRVARAFLVYASTGLLTAAAAALVDAIRDDDADKEWAEKYLDALGSNTADNLNPMGLLPGVKDVLSLLEGYEPSRLDQQSIQKIIWAAQEVDKYIRGESKQNLYGVSYKVMQAVSSVLGIPLSNLMRDGNAIYQTVTGNSPTLTAEAQKNNTVSSLYKAMAEGDKTKAKKLRTELSGKAGMTAKEIDTALAKQLANDPQIQEAWEAKSERDYAKTNRVRNALTAMGFGTETVDKAITQYGSSVTQKETKEKDPNEQLTVTLYTEAEVVSAMRILAGVEKGGSVTEADVRAMISERVAASTAADPEKTVRNGIQSELKKEYLAMEAEGNTEGMRKLAHTMKNLLGTTEETMSGWVMDQHADNLREAVDKYDSSAARRAVTVMRKDGKTDNQIKSSLSKYKQLYIDAVNREDTETANKIKNMLKGLELKGKTGDLLYTDEHFAKWLKEK